MVVGVMTKLQRSLALLVVLIIVLISVPATIVVMKLASFDAAPSNNNSGLGDSASKPVIKPVDAQARDIQQAESTQPKLASVPAMTTTDSQADAKDVPVYRSYNRGFVAGNWVVVDCAKRVVLQCPHKLIDTGTSPRYSTKGSKQVLKGHCRDVSIKVDSFCKI